MFGNSARPAGAAPAAHPADTTGTATEARTVACPSCSAQFTFRRSRTPHIDSCGFESYSFACSECAAPLGGIVDPRDDTLLLCELTTRVR
jgi:predicted nucleic acid-binding Zn ribbon protein